MSPLLQYRETLLAEVLEAAHKKDIPAILASARKLETLESLIALAEKPANRPLPAPRKEPARQAAPTPREEAANGIPAANGADLSPKARGRFHRENLVRMLRRKGVVLEPVRGPIYRTQAGTRLGIAFAREGTGPKKNKWFLGLAEDQFDHVVLMCEGEGHKLMYFSLPKDFLAQHVSRLTRSAGQVKFNVYRRGGEFFLDVPRQEAARIDTYRDKLNDLR